ncbi:murein hydrolase activator EnvC family protein [Candidatus Marimicrobium litorale]|uniref:Peptidase M23 n=1 Tax=Candidatus Marimicrobium litorale TaxID=2518991 RepID=A0ABT3T823_9GAMM|nr:peptidoglycan DD-metalloendopeptidase family protein [Candidatus Marimicrobium litorale]MCX2978330.1 peptidase M23 [Candidatus Marimicrobium litorale]
MPETHCKQLCHAILPVLALLFSAHEALGQSENDTRKQLEQLEIEITQISEELSSATNRQNNLLKQLRDAEVDLGALSRDVNRNKAELTAEQEALSALERDRSEQQAALDKQRDRIAQEIRSAWKMGRQGQLKILLNQENPHAMARSLAYYRYLLTARNTLLEDYRSALHKLQALQARIDLSLTALEQRGYALQKQQTELIAAQAQRKRATQALAQSIIGKNAKLEAKRQDRKQLEELLSAIREAVTELAVPENYKAFRSARGKMVWPVTGNTSNRFNQPRNQGKMRWQGVTIPAQQGTVVRAIHQGRVVYADWLRGSGLLLIIDHGEGYMSLYAHNESLTRNVGEWVSAGSSVSTVGNSGGAEDPALYFEVRHEGKPVDPAKWCK